jgi:hypothetical protein
MKVLRNGSNIDPETLVSFSLTMSASLRVVWKDMDWEHRPRRTMDLKGKTLWEI